MNPIEKYDTITQPKEESTGPWECFIAIREGDTVRTLSGMANEVSLERDEVWGTTNPALNAQYDRYGWEYNGFNVFVHFTEKVVQEVRPYDGRMGDG